MKRILALLIVFVFTGCTFNRFNNESVEKIINDILLTDNKLYNIVLDGYKYYLPFGNRIIDKTDYNVVIMGKKEKYYLYIDVVKYYYKEKYEYVESKDIFYSKTIDKMDKFGYIEINEVNDKYFIEVMYNYAKIEAYVQKNNLKDVLIDISMILSSIKYNDVLLKEYMDSSIDTYQEETFDIFKPKREIGNFLDYVEEYDKYDDSNNNEIELDEDSLGTID